MLADLRYISLCVSAVIKSECFIERRLSPYFLLSSTKSAVSSNAGSELMWLMKARCGSPQHIFFLRRNRESQCFFTKTDKLICVLCEIPFVSLVVHNVLSNTLVKIWKGCVSLIPHDCLLFFFFSGFYLFTKNLSTVTDNSSFWLNLPALLQIYQRQRPRFQLFFFFPSDKSG